MQNVVLSRSLERSLAGRRAAYEDEVARLVRAGIEVMRAQETLDPRVSDIVRVAGLSNQAFYRHFRSKDRLLLAVLEEGRRELLAFLERKLAALDDPAGPADRLRAWIEGIMAQAGNPRAAAATRPFAVHALRLATQFPGETARSAEALRAPLHAALADLGAPDPERDAAALYELVIGRMERLLVAGTVPTPDDVEHLVAFALGAVRR